MLAAIGHLRSFAPPDVFDMNFLAGATPTTGGFTYTRTGTAWDEAQASYGANTPVLNTSRGFYIEGTRTNLFLTSTAPASTSPQTIASMATGTYVCWLTGSGSIAVTGGATGTATAAAPLVFTVTGPVSCTFTVTGTVTHAQVELGLFPTNPIVTAGSSVLRSSPSCSVTRSAVTAGTVAVRCRTPQGVNTGSAQVLWHIDDGSTANFWSIRRSTAGAITFQRNSASATVSIGGGAVTSDADLVVVAAFQGGDTVMKVPGLTVTGTATAPATAPTVERLGEGSGPGSFWDRSFYRVARWSTRLPNDVLDTILQNF